QNPHDGFSLRRLPSSGDGETKGGSGSGGKTGIGFSEKDTGSTMLWFQCTRDEIARRMASMGPRLRGAVPSQRGQTVELDDLADEPEERAGDDIQEFAAKQRGDLSFAVHAGRRIKGTALPAGAQGCMTRRKAEHDRGVGKAARRFR